MGNESIVFILDASPTMLAPYPAATAATDGAPPRIKREGNGASSSGGELTSSSSIKRAMPTTRLDCAKNAIQLMLTYMMIRGGKDNTAAVLVLKTKNTRHHLVPVGDVDDDDSVDPGDIPFANITDLGCGMRKVTPQLLRDLHAVQPEPPNVASNLQGDFSDGIILAVDLMYSQTRTPKTKALSKRQRKIVLVTDAAHVVQLDLAQILHALDGLREMDCPLHVLGLGFGGKSVEYKTPLPADRAVKIQIKQEDDDRMDADEDDDSHHGRNGDHRRSPVNNHKRIKVEPVDAHDNGSNNDDDDHQPMPDPTLSNGYYDEVLVYNTQKVRQGLLVSLTEKTGGSVMACSNMQQVLDAKVGETVTKCGLRKTALCLAPGLTITVHTAKLLDRKSSPRLITHAAMMGGEGKGEMGEIIAVPRRNALGQEMTATIEKAKAYYQAKELFNLDPDETGEEGGDGDRQRTDKEEANLPVICEDQVPAVRYGRDLLVRPKEELNGIKLEPLNTNDDSYNPEEQHIRVLGYVSLSQVPPTLLIGPPYAILGNKSLQACSLVAAVAQALQSQNKVALCVNLKSNRSSEPVLGALFPFLETPEQRQLIVKPVRLLFFQLPFCDDIQVSEMRGFEQLVQTEPDDEDDDMGQQKGDQAKKSNLQVCEDMIDALMLPKDTLCSDQVPYPYARSFYKTIVNRAIHRKATYDKKDIHAMREEQEDFMFTPRAILEGAKPNLEEFRESFPVKKKMTKTATKKGRGKTTLYHDDPWDK